MRPSTAVVLALALASAGCGGRKIDATSMESLKASTDLVTADMTPEQRKTFNDDCLVIRRDDIVKKRDLGYGPRRGKIDPVELAKPYDGYTAEEIHDKAELIRKLKQGTKK